MPPSPRRSPTCAAFAASIGDCRRTPEEEEPEGVLLGMGGEGRGRGARPGRGLAERPVGLPALEGRPVDVLEALAQVAVEGVGHEVLGHGQLPPAEAGPACPLSHLDAPHRIQRTQTRDARDCQQVKRLCFGAATLQNFPKKDERFLAENLIEEIEQTTVNVRLQPSERNVLAGHNS